MPAVSHFLVRRLGAGLAGLLIVFAWPARGAEEFLAPEQAFRLEVAKSGPDEVQLHWSIAPGYYLYRDRIGATASPSGTRLNAELPPGIRKDDPNFGVMEIYHDAVTMKISPAGAAALDVTWQGCADAGLCYPPQKQTIRVASIDVAAPATTATTPRADSLVSGLLAGATGGDRQITQLLGERALAWTLP
ncbi:MAG TPA: protein-disulfide reductase DsbD N-terminal domain-containing protein, partial [Burkholderiaceae bacterium]